MRTLDQARQYMQGWFTAFPDMRTKQTIRVDGRDIEPGAERHQEYVHACRLYRVGHSLRGLPDEDWLRQALRTAEPRP
jgi:hypothetical protein